MTIEVNGKEYEINRPTLRIERNIRKLWESFATLTVSEEDTEFDKSVGVWNEIVKAIFASPDAGLDFDGLTQGEMGDILVDFSAAASAMKRKSV